MMERNQPRVLMVLDRLSVGGTETYVFSVAEELANRGIPVFVAGREGVLKDKFKNIRCPVFTDIDNEISLKRWIKKNRINIIHAHHRKTGKLAADLSRKLGIPFLYTVHSIHPTNIRTVLLLSRMRGLKPAFISVSEPIQKELQEHYISTVVIPNGINMNTYSFHKYSMMRKKLRVPEDASVVLYASRLEGEKGRICTSVIEAVEEIREDFPKIYLLIAGDGKQKGKIRKIINRYRQKHTQFHMIGEQNDMAPIYSISDCVIGTGRVALEALACSRPVIAVGTKGMVGIINPGNYRQALRYHFGDHKGNDNYSRYTIAAMARKVLSSPHKQAHWGKKGRSFVKRKFDVTKIVSRILALYRKISMGSIVRNPEWRIN